MQGNTAEHMALCKNVRCLHYAMGRRASELLRYFTIADTPGVSSSVHEHTEATLSYLRESSALIFLISGGTLLEEDKAMVERFLAAMGGDAESEKALFFIYSQMDRAGGAISSYWDFLEAREKKVEEQQHRIWKELGVKARVVPVSAYMEILARTQQGADSELASLFSEMQSGALVGLRDVRTRLSRHVTSAQVVALLDNIFSSLCYKKQVETSCGSAVLKQVYERLPQVEKLLHKCLRRQLRLSSSIEQTITDDIRALRSVATVDVPDKLARIREGLLAQHVHVSEVDFLVELLGDFRRELDALVTDLRHIDSGLDECRLIKLFMNVPSHIAVSDMFDYEKAMAVLMELSGMADVRSALQDWMSAGSRVMRARHVLGMLNHLFNDYIPRMLRQLTEEMRQEQAAFGAFKRMVESSAQFNTGHLGEAVQTLISQFTLDGFGWLDARIFKLKSHLRLVEADVLTFCRFEFVQNYFSRHVGLFNDEEKMELENLLSGNLDITSIEQYDLTSRNRYWFSKYRNVIDFSRQDEKQCYLYLSEIFQNY